MASWNKGNFATYPNVEIALKLKGNELNTYLTICKYAGPDGGCFPSYEKIAEDTDSARTSVIKSVKSLVERGLLTKEMRKRDNDSHRSNYYRVMDLGVVVPTQPPSSAHATPLTKPTELEQLPKGSCAEAQSPEKDEIKKLFFLVLKKYQLPVINHRHINSWCESLRDAYGATLAELYLTRLLERDINAEAREDAYIPQLGKPMDVVHKAGMIMQYLKKTKGKTSPAAGPNAHDKAYYARIEEQQKRLRGES